MTMRPCKVFAPNGHPQAISNFTALANLAFLLNAASASPAEKTGCVSVRVTQK